MSHISEFISFAELLNILFHNKLLQVNIDFHHNNMSIVAANHKSSRYLSALGNYHDSIIHNFLIDYSFIQSEVKEY